MDIDFLLPGYVAAQRTIATSGNGQYLRIYFFLLLRPLNSGFVFCYFVKTGRSFNFSQNSGVPCRYVGAHVNVFNSRNLSSFSL